MGTAFKMTTDGTFTPLGNFNVGATPNALALGSDGNFYGTTMQGGITTSKYIDGMGTVFMMTPSGMITTLASFNNTNGAYPLAGLTLGKDANFYGTTQNGGNTNVNLGDGYGVVFKLTLNGVNSALTTVASFDDTDGWLANALTLGGDGNLYGTTENGGDGLGTVFTVTTTGGLNSLLSFNGNDGELPSAALTLGNDGNFYGVTPNGGEYDNGTVFKIATTGTITNLYSFSSFNFAANTNADGANPTAALTLGSDGNFYGTTRFGGKYGYGTVFKVTTNGAMTTLATFDVTNGAEPQAAMTLGNDGYFYGTTPQGGSNSCGTIFRLLFPANITTQPQSWTTNAGATVTFHASATGLQPMTFQWQRYGTNLINGGNIAGATTDTLVISDVSDDDAGTYSLIVINPGGNSSSANATLRVNDTPFIASEPQSQTVGVGGTVTFTATVYGAPPLVYQWYFYNTPLGSPGSGTNILSYTLTNIRTNQAGNYSVQICNGYGNATSSNAMLTVVNQPTLTLRFLTGYPLVNLGGALGNNYVVQYSTNLASRTWMILLSLTNLTGSPYQFLDSAGAGQPMRFYRAFVQPSP
jgi:uncharacterized repeat protein (TIGR03803 family)